MRGVLSKSAAGVVLTVATAVVLPSRLASAGAPPGGVSAATIQRTCVAAYEESQTQMRRSHLHEARASLQTCLDEACPSTLRADCAGWLKEVETRTPTVVFEIVQDGAPVKEAKLVVDGKPQPVDGRAMETEPGEHSFKVDAPTGTASTHVLLREGEKLRVVRLELPATRTEAAIAVSPARPRSTTRPVPWTVWATGGVGIASLGVFGAFAAIGKSEEHDLEPCKPTCTQDRIDHVHGRYVAADVFLGIGVVALGAASVLYLTRPRVPTEKSALLELVTGQPVVF